jgi:hypothetical protein
MATAKSALKAMRGICLSLPETTEADHFGESMFRVRGRGFASCGEKDGVWIDAAGVRDWDEVRALVLESFRLIADPAKARGRRRRAPRRP